MYESIRSDRCPKKRSKLGMELCEKAGCTWDEPVSLDEFPEKEKTVGIGTCVMSLNCVPIAEQTTTIWGNLVYTSSNNFEDKLFLALGGDKMHYDAITCTKKLMGARSFCMKCLKSFTHKQEMEQHNCNAEKRNHKESNTDGLIPDELPRYMFRKTKLGSEEEIVERTANVKTERAKRKHRKDMMCPTYIIFDCETDQSTGFTESIT